MAGVQAVFMENLRTVAAMIWSPEALIRIYREELVVIAQTRLPKLQLPTIYGSDYMQENHPHVWQHGHDGLRAEEKQKDTWSSFYEKQAT